MASRLQKSADEGSANSIISQTRGVGAIGEIRSAKDALISTYI